MTYDPIADGDLLAPVLGTSAAWPALHANDAEVFQHFTPGFAAGLDGKASVLAREYRFRWWGNADGVDVNARLNVQAHIEAFGTGPGDGAYVAVTGPIQTYSQAFVPTTAAWYGGTLYTGGGFPTSEVSLVVPAPGAGSFAINGLRANLDLSAPVAGTRYPSGFRLIGSTWGTAGMSVPSEIQSRVRTNPARLARDRPICVAAHVSDTLKTVSAKSFDVWGAHNETRYAQVGRLLLPRCDVGRRLYRLDAFANEDTPGTAEFSVRVGSREERWSGSGWHSWQVELGPGPHEVTGNIMPGAGNGAAIRTLTAWRTNL